MDRQSVILSIVRQHDEADGDVYHAVTKHLPDATIGEVAAALKQSADRHLQEATRLRAEATAVLGEAEAARIYAGFVNQHKTVQ